MHGQAVEPKESEIPSMTGIDQRDPLLAGSCSCYCTTPHHMALPGPGQLASEPAEGDPPRSIASASSGEGAVGAAPQKTITWPSSFDESDVESPMGIVMGTSTPLPSSAQFPQPSPSDSEPHQARPLQPFHIEIVRRSGRLLTVQVTKQGTGSCCGGAAFFLEVLYHACEHAQPSGHPRPRYPIEEALQRWRVLAGDVGYLCTNAPRFVLRAELVHHDGTTGEIGTFLMQTSDTCWSEACQAGLEFSVLSATYSQEGGFAQAEVVQPRMPAATTPNAEWQARDSEPPHRSPGSSGATSPEPDIHQPLPSKPGGQRRRRRRIAVRAAQESLSSQKATSKTFSQERIEQILDWQRKKVQRLVRSTLGGVARSD